MKLFYILTIILFSTSCNSCSILKKQDRKTKEAVTNPATWEEKFLNNFQKGPYDEAWGLFSYSGYQDAGQIMLYKSSKHSEGILDFVDKSKSKITDTIAIEKDTFEAFSSEVSKAKNLKDFDSGAFDGVVYTFIHLEKEGDKVFENQKIRMNNPRSSNPASKAHLDLISLFEKLAAR